MNADIVDVKVSHASPTLKTRDGLIKMYGTERHPMADVKSNAFYEVSGVMATGGRHHHLVTVEGSCLYIQVPSTSLFCVYVVLPDMAPVFIIHPHL